MAARSPIQASKGWRLEFLVGFLSPVVGLDDDVDGVLDGVLDKGSSNPLDGKRIEATNRHNLHPFVQAPVSSWMTKVIESPKIWEGFLW